MWVNTFRCPIPKYRFLSSDMYFGIWPTSRSIFLNQSWPIRCIHENLDQAERHLLRSVPDSKVNHIQVTSGIIPPFYPDVMCTICAFLLCSYRDSQVHGKQHHGLQKKLPSTQWRYFQRQNQLETTERLTRKESKRTSNIEILPTDCVKRHWPMWGSTWTALFASSKGYQSKINRWHNTCLALLIFLFLANNRMDMAREKPIVLKNWKRRHAVEHEEDGDGVGDRHHPSVPPAPNHA